MLNLRYFILSKEGEANKKLKIIYQIPAKSSLGGYPLGETFTSWQAISSDTIRTKIGLVV